MAGQVVIVQSHGIELIAEVPERAAAWWSASCGKALLAHLFSMLEEVEVVVCFTKQLGPFKVVR